MAIVTIALHHQILEHPALVRVRDYVKPAEARARDVLRLALPFVGEGQHVGDVRILGA